MLRQSIRSFKSIALSLAFGTLATASLVGCSSSEPSSSGADDPADNVLITSSDIEALGPGKSLDISLKKADTVYRFDYSAAPIDYSRVRLVLDSENRDSVLLDAQVQHIETADYGAYPKPDMHGNASPWFKLASDPEYFGILDPAELVELKTKGYFYSEQPPAAPSGTPQTTDNCTHAVCVVCTNPVTGAPYDWNTDYPGTPPVCVNIEHVWCD